MSTIMIHTRGTLFHRQYSNLSLRQRDQFGIRRPSTVLADGCTIVTNRRLKHARE